MKFCSFLMAIALAMTLALGSGAEAKPLNILYIMSDDHAAHAISAYGGRLAEVAPTPNLDRLAAGGMRFTNAFVTNSICTPSRAVLWTGKYSHRNGVYKFTGLDQSQPTLPKYMQAHGYQTGFVGKYHLHTNPVGFDHWAILPGQGSYHDTAFVEMGDEDPSGVVKKGKKTTYEGWHSSDIITKKALDWFEEERDSTKPFFYMLHYKAPHDLWEHAHRYDDYLEDVEIPEPENLMDSGSGRSPAIEQSTQEIAGRSHHTRFTKEIVAMAPGPEKRRLVYQEYMKRYLRCVKGVDDNLGKVFDYLEESGLAENTVVIYTADQGFFLGEHGLYDKRLIYEEALRVPLLVRWPGVVKAGSVRDEIVLNLDYAETILDLAGHAVPSDMQGRSLVPLLKGEVVEDWREAFYYRYYFSHFDTPAHMGVRTATEKLIHLDGMDHWELYDLKNDPSEVVNRADDPEYRERLVALKERLVELREAVGDDLADIGDQPRTGNAELDAFAAKMEKRQAEMQAALRAKEEGK
jgi:arylsulfatase A-like enzyme